MGSSLLPRALTQSIRRTPRFVTSPTLTQFRHRTGAATKPDTQPINDPAPPASPTNVSSTNALPIEPIAQSEVLVEVPEIAEERRVAQAPNHEKTWSRSQNPRADAMVGPRFEQTIMEYQPRPYAAIELSHMQPVKFIHGSVAKCDGGGGPLGHPRVFINIDKPEVIPCEYCSLPYANEHHKSFLEANPDACHGFPLTPSNHSHELPMGKRAAEDSPPYFQR